jgi:hypothetical protein
MPARTPTGLTGAFYRLGTTYPAETRNPSQRVSYESLGPFEPSSSLWPPLRPRYSQTACARKVPKAAPPSPSGPVGHMGAQVGRWRPKGAKGSKGAMGFQPCPVRRPRDARGRRAARAAWSPGPNKPTAPTSAASQGYSCELGHRLDHCGVLRLRHANFET